MNAKVLSADYAEERRLISFCGRAVLPGRPFFHHKEHKERKAGLPISTEGNEGNKDCRTASPRGAALHGQIPLAASLQRMQYRGMAGHPRPTFCVKTVPREFMIEAWERQCALAEEPTRVLMKQFMDEQPAVGIYLTVCDEQLGDESERSQLIPLASAVWEAMTRMHALRLKMVRPKIVERADTANIRMLEKLEDVSEYEWRETVTRMFLGYNQQPLLAFCIEILMANDEETPELAPQRIGMELMWLKTVIDCFDQ
jgi:hypothetical protein